MYKWEKGEYHFFWRVVPPDCQLTVKIVSNLLCSWKHTFLSFFNSNKRYNEFSLHYCWTLFPQEMITLRNKRKLAADSRETLEHPENSHTQNTFFPGITEEYITQISEEIEGGSLEKLSQEFSRTESRTSCALSNLDEFLLNSTHRFGHSLEPLREHPGALTWKTGNQMGLVHWMIPIPKWSYLPVGLTIQMTPTRKRSLTVTDPCLKFSSLSSCGGHLMRFFTVKLWEVIIPG